VRIDRNGLLEGARYNSPGQLVDFVFGYSRGACFEINLCPRNKYQSMRPWNPNMKFSSRPGELIEPGSTESIYGILYSDRWLNIELSDNQ